MSGGVTADLIATALDLTKRSVQERAVRERWIRTVETVQGGKRHLYPVEVLPPEVRARVLAHMAATAPAVVRAAPPVPVVAPAALGLTAAQRRCENARLAILAEIDRLTAHGGTVERAITTLIKAAADGTLTPELLALIPVANARASAGRTLSRRAVFDWRRAVLEGRSLAPKAAAPRGPAVPDWAPTLMGLYRTPQKRSLAAVLEDLPKALPEGVAPPSYDQARRFLQTVGTVTRNKGRMGPNALRALKAYRRRDTSGLEPLDIATADGHCFKGDIAHPFTGKPFRPEVTAIVDVATRFAFGWSAGIAESTHAVMDAIRNGVTSLGVPAIYYSDNGAGHTSHAMDDEIIGFLARLGVTHETSQPGRAQSRGLIERIQGSLWIRAAKKLPSFSGADMDREARRVVVKLTDRDLKERGASRLLMGWKDFLAWCAAEVAAYNDRPHRSLPKVRDPVTGKVRHQSPAECLAAWRAKNWQPVTLGEAEAADLWRPQVQRTTFRGEISLPWGKYFHRDLEAYGRERVVVGYDIHDGSRVWVRDLQGRLLAVAIRDGNTAPYMPASKLEHAQDKRADGRTKLLQRHLADVEAERRGPGQMIDVTPPSEGEVIAAQAQLRRLEAEPLPAAPEPAPEPAADPDARPTFDREESWARWVLAHPDQATPADRALLQRRMESMSFRLLLGIDDDETQAAIA